MTTKYHLPLICAMAAMTAACSSSNPGDEPAKPTFTPHLAKVTAVQYNPAPGQFVNELPEYEPGDTQSDMNRKALQAINNGDLISLGALGGEIIITLDRPITHDPDAVADFRVLGNAYTTGTVDGRTTGSAEPGIVYIMEDTNGNGLPDDTWFALRGQMYSQQSAVTITYTPAPSPTSQRWVDWQLDNGSAGALTCNTAYHNHTYFPLWNDATTMTIRTDMLPANGYYNTATGQYTQFCYAGYADSYPNNSDLSALSIADAVADTPGTVLPRRADFIRIVTGIIDSNGPLGECSTEVGGIQLLHD